MGNFCPTCGNLLDVPKDDDVITCAQCGHTEDAVQYENISITTRSHPDAFPSILKDRRSVVKSLADNKDLQDDMTKKQEIEEKCPDCGHPTMTFHTLQLRSADEGSTVFYECPNCGHKHSTNN